MNETVLFRLMGVSFRTPNERSIFAAMQPGQLLRLEPEPTNPHDADAIKVLSPESIHIGYVARDATQDVHWVLRESASYTARLRSKIGGASALIEVVPDNA